MNGPYVLGPVRQSGGTIYYVNGCTLGREVYWTLVSGPGTLTRITKYPNAHGVAAAFYSADAGTAGQQPVIRASQKSDMPVYNLLNKSFETAGATAYDAANWDFAYGNNGASLWTSSGYVERSASERGRQPYLRWGKWDVSCQNMTPIAGSYLWSFVSSRSGNGCSETSQFWTGSGAIVGYTAAWAQISQIATWDDIASLTIYYGYNGYWNAHFGSLGTPRFHVYIASTLNTAHGSWAPALDASTERVANISFETPPNVAPWYRLQLVQSSVTIDTSAITGTKYLVMRVIGGASTTLPQWFYIDNIVTT